MIMKMYGKQNLIYRIYKLLILIWAAMKTPTLVLMVLGLVPSFSSAERLNLIIPENKLEQYIAVVNDTKQVLDDPDAMANVQQQKYALCQRIQAYQDILQLTEQHPKMENAAVMKVIAQNYLTQQQQSFENSAMNQQAFCHTN